MEQYDRIIIGRNKEGDIRPYIRTRNDKVEQKALQYCKAKWPEYTWETKLVKPIRNKVR